MLFLIRVHIVLPFRPVKCGLHLIVIKRNKQLTAFLTENIGFFFQSLSLVSDKSFKYYTFLVPKIRLDTIKH